MTTQPTLLGKILIALFPKFIERLIYLDKLQQRIYTTRYFVRTCKHTDRFADQCKHRQELIKLIKEFNANKMWFMKRNGR